MPKALKKIALYARKDGDDLVEVLANLNEMLAEYNVVWETDTAKIAGLSHVTTVTQDELGKNQDLIIVVGGDGSILRCAQASMQHNTPVIGINKGRLGFLADIRPNELSTRLQAVLDGEYWTAERFLLQTKVQYPNKTKLDCQATLNDVILYPANMPHMLEFEIYVDDQFLCSHRADGLIVATPTGSTAYSLSAGGPIIQPNVDAIVMLAMFSHSLTDRPVVVPGDSQIRIEFSLNNEFSAKLSCNADNDATLQPGSIITIEKATKKIKLLHPLDYDYYESLRSKLHWGHRLTT